MGGVTGRAVPPVADRLGFRVLLRLCRRRGQPVLPGPLRGHRGGRPPRTPEEGYTLTEDLADRAITWVRQQKALAPGQAVLHVLRTRRDTRAAPRARGMVGQVQGEVRKPAGTYLREKIFAEQKKLGVIPNDAELIKRHDVIPAWDDMAAELKPVLARQMEIYAGFMEQADF